MDTKGIISDNSYICKVSLLLMEGTDDF